MENVRSSSSWVATHSSHVTRDSSAIEKVDRVQGGIPKVEWDFEGIHYFDNGPLAVQYLLVLDALNFCFWPDEELNYDDLASGLKAAVENDNSVFDADRLQKYTGKHKNPISCQFSRSRESYVAVRGAVSSEISLCSSWGAFYPISFFPDNGARPELRETLKWPRPLPLEDEHIRLLHECWRRTLEGKLKSCGGCSRKIC